MNVTLHLSDSTTVPLGDIPAADVDALLADLDRSPWLTVPDGAATVHINRTQIVRVVLKETP